MATDDDKLGRLEKKIAAAQESRRSKAPANTDKEYTDRAAGMRAGSEFMAYILSGGLLGWGIGHFFGNTPLWLIGMLFAGFGLGVWRAYLSMNAK